MESLREGIDERMRMHGKDYWHIGPENDVGGVVGWREKYKRHTLTLAHVHTHTYILSNTPPSSNIHPGGALAQHQADRLRRVPPGGARRLVCLCVCVCVCVCTIYIYVCPYVCLNICACFIIVYVLYCVTYLSYKCQFMLHVNYFVWCVNVRVQPSLQVVTPPSPLSPASFSFSPPFFFLISSLSHICAHTNTHTRTLSLLLPSPSLSASLPLLSPFPFTASYFVVDLVENRGDGFVF